MDVTEGPVVSLSIHMKNIELFDDKSGKDLYIFRWLSMKLDKVSVNTRRKKQFSRAISQYLPKLVNMAAYL